jgi:hypothetical protein
MPLNSLNKEWDEEDPNAAIPTVQNHKEHDAADLELGGQDASSLDKSAGSNTGAVHVEQIGQTDDSITPEKKA